MLKSITECFTFLRRFPVRLEIPMRSLALVQKWQKTFHNNPANIRLDEDVFKTSWSRRIYSIYWCVFRRRLQDVMIKTNIFVLVIRLQDVFKTSSRRLQDVLSRHLQNIFKTSSRRLAKTSSRHFQYVFKTFSRRLQDVFKTSSRRLAKTFSKHLQDVFMTFSTLFQDLFKLFSRRLAKMSSGRFQDVSSS